MIQIHDWTTFGEVIVFGVVLAIGWRIGNALCSLVAHLVGGK